MITNGAAASPAELMTMFAERAARGDAAGLLALYEPEAVFEPQLGVTLRGSAEILPALEELASLRPRIEYTGEPDVVVVDDRDRVERMGNGGRAAGRIDAPRRWSQR